MAKIEKVLPSIFGQPRAAQISTHHPGMPTPYEGLSRDLKSFGANMQSAFDNSLHLARDGQRAALIQAQAEFDLEVSEAMQKEVFSLKGLPAADCEAKAGEIFRRAETRQLEKIGAYGGSVGRDFQMMVMRSRASMLPQVTRHAEGEIRRARVASAELVQKNKLLIHSMTGSDTEIEDALAALRESAVAQGAEVPDLGVFDQNVASGFVDMGGKRCPISDGKFNGPNGPVSVSALRDRIVDTPYTKDRQFLIDGAHSARITQLIKWNDIAGAEAVLEKYNPANGSGDRSDIPLAKYPISPSVFAAMKEQVGRHRRDLNAHMDGGAAVAGALADYAESDTLSMGGRLWSQALEAKLATVLADQHRKALVDPTGVESIKYRAMKQGFEQARSNATMFGKAQADLMYRLLSKWGGPEKDLWLPGNETALLNAFALIPDSYVKESFLPLIVKNVAAANEEARGTPEAKAGRAAMVLEIARCAAAGIPLDFNTKGKPREEGLVLDLSDEQSLQIAIRLAGLDNKEQQRLWDMMHIQVPMDMAAAQLVSLLQEFPGLENLTERTAMRVAPEIIEELQRIVKWFPNRAKDEDWVKGTLRDILTVSVRAERGFWGKYRDVTFPEYLRTRLAEDKGGYKVSYQDFATRYCTTQEQTALRERYEQDLRRLAIPRRPDEKDDSLVVTRRFPEKVEQVQVKAQAARRREVAVDDGRGGVVYWLEAKAEELNRKAEENKRKEAKIKAGEGSLFDYVIRGLQEGPSVEPTRWMD